jgi:hypothetical protein
MPGQLCFSQISSSNYIVSQDIFASYERKFRESFFSLKKQWRIVLFAIVYDTALESKGHHEFVHIPGHDKEVTYHKDISLKKMSRVQKIFQHSALYTR